MIPVRHIGSNGCNEIAFFFKKRLLPGDRLRADNAIPLSGEVAVVKGDAVLCGHCHDHIFMHPLTGSSALQQEDDQ